MANIETPLSPAPVITVVNKDGSTATGYTGNVTIALDTNPTAATLTGTTTIAATAGVATFSDLELTRSGKNFTLRATAAAQGGYTPKARVSRPFTIATRMVFTTQPTSVAAPDDIIPLFTVTAQDGAGNTDTAYTGEVTVALYTGAGLGILSGLFTRTAVAGVADFSGLSIDAEGTYSLRATGTEVFTAYPPAPVISNLFGVGVYILTAVDLGGGTSFGKSVSLGSLVPGTFNGYTVRGLSVTIYVDYFGAGVNGYETSINTSGAPPQTLFTTLVVNGVTFLSSAATYSNVPNSSWTWPIALTAPFASAGTYPVSIT